MSFFKMAMAVALIGATALIYGRVTASQGDFATLGFDTPNGVDIFRVDSSGDLVPGTNLTREIGSPTLQIKTIYVGQIVPAQYSSTTIASMVPAAVGAIIGSSTRKAVCVATGTAAGAFVFQSSNPATITGQACL